MKTARIAIPVVLAAAVGFACLPAFADSTPPASATVTITDTGFTPSAVVIRPNGTVTWTNQGVHVHTATSVGGATMPFNTGGLQPGQSFTQALGVPGPYYYSSAPDCLNGNFFASFPCGSPATVIVSDSMDQADAMLASLAATPTPSATPNPAASGPVANATVLIDDTGITPATVTVFQNGTVTFINRGFNIHAVLSKGTPGWHGFDSGGLVRGHGATFTMDQVGTFSYTEPPDCVPNRNPQFNCGPYQIVVVPGS